MLTAPAGYFKYQSPRWQHTPQHFKDRLAVASDVGMVQAWMDSSDIQEVSRPFDGSRRQLGQQGLGLLEIERVEAFGEPAVDRSEKVARLTPLSLIAPKPRHAHRRA